MSIAVAPAGVVFKYNGFEFPTNIRTKVSEEPVQSGDNRQVKYSKLTITVSGFITQAEHAGRDDEDHPARSAG